MDSGRFQEDVRPETQGFRSDLGCRWVITGLSESTEVQGHFEKGGLRGPNGEVLNKQEKRELRCLRAQVG